MSFEWKGDKALTAAERGRKKGLYAGAILVHGSAVLKCPVGVYPKGSGKVGGNLRSSLSFSVEGGSAEGGKGDDVVGASPPEEAVIGTNVEYAARVEFGFEGTDSLGRTYDQKGQSYLTAAFNENKKAAKELFRKAMKEELERG